MIYWQSTYVLKAPNLVQNSSVSEIHVELIKHSYLQGFRAKQCQRLLPRNSATLCGAKNDEVELLRSIFRVQPPNCCFNSAAVGCTSLIALSMPQNFVTKVSGVKGARSCYSR